MLLQENREKQELLYVCHKPWNFYQYSSVKREIQLGKCHHDEYKFTMNWECFKIVLLSLTLKSASIVCVYAHRIGAFVLWTVSILTLFSYLLCCPIYQSEKIFR